MSSWDMLGNAVRWQGPPRAQATGKAAADNLPPQSHVEISRTSEKTLQSALTRLLSERYGLVLWIGLLLAVIGCSVVMFIPFPYKATALIFVDPRDEKVTLQEEVLPGIGTDAAVLESAVQIGKSDGFLIELAQKLGLLAGSKTWTGSPDQMKELDRLRKKLVIDRMGATYLVEVTYTDNESREAARIANSAAQAFADTQNKSRQDATANADRTLKERLVDIRKKLNDSEDAIARFKAANGIVYVQDNLTVQMRQLADASQQLALLNAAADEAQARFDQSRDNGVITRATGQDPEGGEQLAYLRRQLAQLSQTADQQSQIYGARHPKLAETKRMIEGVQRQIASQRQQLDRSLKAERDISVSKRNELQTQIATLSAAIGKSEAAKVQLATLEREASADRDLYQQLLGRSKQTSELALMPTDNARIVSMAVEPSRSTRPPLALLVPVILFLSLACALALVVGRNIRAYRR